ncbi:MAG: hypothetical protein JWM82_4103, partial [Myxococcales bacterium]|nr:hypothetical protein [Myxococcales bacterium]
MVFVLVLGASCGGKDVQGGGAGTSGAAGATGDAGAP